MIRFAGYACIAAGAAITAAQVVSAAEDLAAEKAFASLLLGLYSADPCDNITRGAKACPPRFAEREMTFSDDGASQSYRFEANRCIVHAETVVASSGERYTATFNLQNVLYVNLNTARQEGNLKEVEIFLQGQDVLVAGGRSGNVLTFIHKYYATAEGDIGHDVRQEVLAMRKALKAYQERHCGSMG